MPTDIRDYRRRKAQEAEIEERRMEKCWCCGHCGGTEFVVPVNPSVALFCAGCGWQFEDGHLRTSEGKPYGMSEE